MKIDILTYNEKITEILKKRFPNNYIEEKKEKSEKDQRNLYKFLDIEQKELFSVDLESPLFCLGKGGYAIKEHATGRVIRSINFE